MKQNLIVLSILMNCSINALPESAPRIGGIIVAGAGLTAAACVKRMLEGDDTRRIALGLSVLSLAAGYGLYQYLDDLPSVKLDKACNILAAKEKDDILGGLFNKSAIDHEKLLFNIQTQYPGHYSEMRFINNHYSPFVSDVTHAHELLKSGLRALANKLNNGDGVKKQLQEKKKMCKGILIKALALQDRLEKDTSNALGEKEAYYQCLTDYNQSDTGSKNLKLQEKRASYVYALLENAVFMNRIYELFLALWEQFRGTTV